MEYSPQLSQQHSIVSTQVNQQQLMELSTQKQRGTQQTSESQQRATPSSLEHLSLVAQQYSTMTTQAYLSPRQQSVPNMPLPSLQTFKTTHAQQEQSVGTSLHTQVPPQLSGSYSLTQSQQQNQFLSASQQATLLEVDVEASPQSTQQGLSHQTKVLSSPSTQIAGQLLMTLQPSPTTSKEELKSSSPSQPQQQQNQSNYSHSQATKASSVSPVTHILNGSSISPGIEYLHCLDTCHSGFRLTVKHRMHKWSKVCTEKSHYS